MVTTIEATPNTFYVRKDLSGDIGISPAYGDVYTGLGTNTTLKSSADTNIFMGKTNVITDSDWQYGDGEITEMYLGMYANSLSQANTQTAPWVDVYKLKDNISITEGNLVITSGTVGNPTVLSSYIDFQTPWIVEDFDGVNKWFMESPDSPLDTGKIIMEHSLRVTREKLMQALATNASDVWLPNPLGETGIGDWFDRRAAWLVGGSSFGPGKNEYVLLTKKENGKYYPSFQGKFLGFGTDDNTGVSGVGGRTREEWLKLGAEPVTSMIQFQTINNQFDENFLAKATQYNTIFYNVHQAPDIRDIKDQTLEGPGDTSTPMCYTYANLENGAGFGDGSILRLKSLWENYSGSLDGTDAQDRANPFGRGSTSGSPFTQDIMAPIAGIPMPVPMDVTTSHPLLADNDVPSYAPEIEIVFKINQMPVAPKIRNASSVGKFLATRCFTVKMAPTAPSGDETGMGDYQLATAGFPFIQFIRTEESSGLVNVFCNGESTASSGPMVKKSLADGNYLFYDTLSNVQGTAYDTTIPMGEWINMRIKLDMNRANKSLVYFTTVASGGAISQAHIKTDNAFSGTGKLWPSCLTLWTSNLRAINASSSTTGGVNYNLLPDSMTDDDKIVDIMVDRIAFYGWNTSTTNTTIVKENPSPGLVDIPAAMSVRPLNSGSIDVNLSGQDKFFGLPNAIASSYISLGFDSKSSVSGSKFFFNDFFAINEAQIKPIPYISGGYWDQGTYTTKIGKEWFSNLAVQDSPTNDGIQVGGDTNYVDRFTQKGWIGVSSSFVDAGSGDVWSETGNPLHQAKILSIGDNGRTITVDKPQIFNLPSDTRYVIEIGGGMYTYPNLLAGTGSCGYKTALYQEGPPNGNTITLSRSVLADDINGNQWDVWNPVSGASSMPALNISPYKYWLNLQIANVSSSTGYASWWQTATGSNATLLAKRNYTAVLPVSGGTTFGSTYNEFLYDDGLSLNHWNFDFTDPSDNVVELETDYGFGAIKANDEASLTAKGYIRRDFFRAGQNYLNMTNYITTARPKPNTIFNFVVKPTFMDMVDSEYKVNIDTSEGSNKAEMIFGLTDSIPEVSILTATPLLTPFAPESVGSTMQSIALSWDEQNKDTWYRALFVSDKNIDNKYHNINFWTPLNETGSTFGYYTSQTDATKTNFNNSGTLTADIEGFTGYGAKFDGTDDYLVSSEVRVLASGLAKWSFLCHTKPSAATGTIFDTYYTASQFKIDVSSNRIVVTHAGSSKTLTSTNRYDCDGVQPLAIGVTYDQNALDNNWKLFVNGKLEDTQDYSTAISISGNVFVGASGNSVTSGSNYFTGFIEEITSYSGSTIYFPSNVGQYILDASSYNDVVTGSTTNDSIPYTARLFVMDYHNIRGKNTRDIGKSPMVSWKVTGI